MSQHGVKLSQAQKKALVKAVEQGKGYKLKLSKKALVGGELLSFTKPQLSKIATAHRKGKSVEISLSKAQLKKMAMQGGGLWDDVKSVASSAYKYVAPKVKKYAGDTIRTYVPPAVGALTGLTGTYLGGPVAGAVAGKAGQEAIKYLTQKEIMGFGIDGRPLVSTMARGRGFTTVGNGFTTVGNGGGFRTVGSGSTTGGSVGRPDYGGQVLGNRFLEAQRYLYGVAQPTSMDGRGFCCPHCG